MRATRSPIRRASASRRSSAPEPLDGRFGLDRGLVREALVEETRDPVQGRLVDRVVVREVDQRLLDGALAQDEDQAGHPLVDRDEVDPPDVGGAGLGRGGQAGRPRDARERRGGEAEPVLAGELHLAELVPDHQLLDGRQRHGIDDRFDVEAVPGIGRHASGRGVRVGQQTGRLELGEDAADGRTGHAEAVALHERLRSDRRGGRDIFLDDGPKDRLCAKVQGADGAASSRQGRSPTVVSTLVSRVLTRCSHRSSEASRVSIREPPADRGFVVRFRRARTRVSTAASPSPVRRVVRGVKRRAVRFRERRRLSKDRRCVICGEAVWVADLTATAGPRRTCHMEICTVCGHVSNLANTHDYGQYETIGDIPIKPRVGTADRKGREFYMAEMAIDILGRTDLDVLVYSAGRSLDNHHIAALPSVRSVAISDVIRLRDDAEFYDSANRRRGGSRSSSRARSSSTFSSRAKTSSGCSASSSRRAARLLDERLRRGRPAAPVVHLHAGPHVLLHARVTRGAGCRERLAR